MKRTRSIVLGVIGGMGLAAGLAAGQDEGMKPVLGGVRDPIIMAPITVCFAEGSDPLYVQRVTALTHQLNVLRFGVDYNVGGRWSGAQGTPRALSWSFAPDGLTIPGNNGEPTSPNVIFATLDSQFASQGGRATWVSRFVQVFARYQELSGLTYTRITVGGNDWDDGAAWGTGGAAGARGDIRICAHPIDGGTGSNVLAYNSFPSNGDMVLDSQNSWSSTSNSNRFLRNVVAHEHGHGIGISHVCPANSTKLMEPFITTAYDGPQQDDIRAAQRHYGDPYENNDTSGTARAVGSLTIPGQVIFGAIPSPAVSSAALLSLDADGKIDFWSFSVPGSCLITVTAMPIGSNYASYVQDANCNTTGVNTNAVAVANLTISLIGTNGTTVLASSETQAAGAAEVLANAGLPGAGTYYVRISESSSPTQSQLYRLTLDVTGVPVCPQFTQHPVGQTVCEFTPVSFTVAATGTPTPTYQWRKNQVNIGNQTSPTLNLGFATTSNAGTYDCVVTNACGSATSNPAVLTVNTSPVFTTHPANQSVPAGSPASFTVVVTGSPAPALQWRKDSVNIPGATGPVYSIASVSAGDAGSYDCVATNSCDSATSTAATLTVTAGCYADCDQSGGLTANDFQCFLNAFAGGQTYANCDGAGGLTANDFQCFLDAYANGCP